MASLKAYCATTGGATVADMRMCNLLDPVAHAIGRMVSLNAEPKRICKKLAKEIPELCEVRRNAVRGQADRVARTIVNSSSSQVVNLIGNVRAV